MSSGGGSTERELEAVEERYAGRIQRAEAWAGVLFGSALGVLLGRVASPDTPLWVALLYVVAASGGGFAWPGVLAWRRRRRAVRAVWAAYEAHNAYLEKFYQERRKAEAEQGEVEGDGEQTE